MTSGYTGMSKKADLYALDTTNPWADFSNPGPVREGTDGSLDAGAQRDQQAIYYGRVRLVPAQDGPFFYTRSHLSALQNCALLSSTNFQFIFIFKRCITQFSH